ncbi:MAG TPA: ABC transporter permease [Firmicutes bacterium]|nr:ABC transporter permease [Bacillota bacterium]
MSREVPIPQNKIPTDWNKVTEEKLVVGRTLTQRQLIWRRFRRHRLGVFGAAVVLVLAVLSVFAPFFAPYDYTKPEYRYAYVPPQRVRFVDSEGNFHWRPFVYGLKYGVDEVTWQRVYVEDPKTIHPIKFFVRGWEYSLFGIIKSDIHLFGVDPPGTLYLFGTDHLGRDLFSRVLFGGRVSIFIALMGATISAAVGSFIGGVSGYFSGKVDSIIQRIVELLQLFPQLPLMMALSAAIPTNWPPMGVFVGVVVVMTLVQWTYLAREVRGKVLSYREADFVLAAKVSGAKDLYIIIHHIIPNCLSHIIVVLTITIPNLVLAESSLSFLGLGIQPPMVSWGVLLRNASNLQTIGQYPWIMIPGVVILITILAFNFLGDGLRDAADPYGN